MEPQINIIAALGRNRELGKQNELIWRVSADLKRVKALTTGHPIIMGRKTYESIGRPLPNRTNIVISASVKEIEGCLVCGSFEKALEAARAIDPEEIFIFGGASVYERALPHTDRLYLTLVDAEDSDADTFFPDYKEFNKVIEKETHMGHEPPFTWVTLERE